MSAEDLQKMTVIVKTHHGSDLRDGVIGGVQKGYGGLNSVFGQILLGGDAQLLSEQLSKIDIVETDGGADGLNLKILLLVVRFNVGQRLFNMCFCGAFAGWGRGGCVQLFGYGIGKELI